MLETSLSGNKMFMGLYFTIFNIIYDTPNTFYKSLEYQTS